MGNLLIGGGGGNYYMKSRHELPNYQIISHHVTSAALQLLSNLLIPFHSFKRVQKPATWLHLEAMSDSIMVDSQCLTSQSTRCLGLMNIHHRISWMHSSSGGNKEQGAIQIQDGVTLLFVISIWLLFEPLFPVRLGGDWTDDTNKIIKLGWDWLKSS